MHINAYKCHQSSQLSTISHANFFVVVELVVWALLSTALLHMDRLDPTFWGTSGPQRFQQGQHSTRKTSKNSNNSWNPECSTSICPSSVTSICAILTFGCGHHMPHAHGGTLQTRDLALIGVSRILNPGPSMLNAGSSLAGFSESWKANSKLLKSHHCLLIASTAISAADACRFEASNWFQLGIEMCPAMPSLPCLGKGLKSNQKTQQVTQFVKGYNSQSCPCRGRTLRKC